MKKWLTFFIPVFREFLIFNTSMVTAQPKTKEYFLLTYCSAGRGFSLRCKSLVSQSFIHTAQFAARNLEASPACSFSRKNKLLFTGSSIGDASKQSTSLHFIRYSRTSFLVNPSSVNTTNPSQSPL